MTGSGKIGGVARENESGTLIAGILLLYRAGPLVLSPWLGSQTFIDPVLPGSSDVLHPAALRAMAGHGRLTQCHALRPPQWGGSASQTGSRVVALFGRSSA